MPSKLDEHASFIQQSLEKGVSQRQIAEELGCSRSNLQFWLKKNPTDKQDGLSENPTEDYIEIPVIYRDYSDMETLYVYPMGDIHKGSEAHATDRWLEWLTYLESNNETSLLCTGDMFNAALKNSKSESYDELLTVGQSKRELRAELKTLAKAERIDLLMPGNHDDRVYRAVGDCPVMDLADSLEVPYARDAVLVVYQVGDIRYEVYIRHGSGGGQVGARANRLVKQAQTLIADIYVSGHTHSQLVFPQDVFQYNPDEKKVVRRRQLFVSSGSFLNYEGYAANRGYSPQKLGAPRIRLDGTRYDPHVSV